MQNCHTLEYMPHRHEWWTNKICEPKSAVYMTCIVNVKKDTRERSCNYRNWILKTNKLTKKEGQHLNYRHEPPRFWNKELHVILKITGEITSEVWPAVTLTSLWWWTPSVAKRKGCFVNFPGDLALLCHHLRVCMHICIQWALLKCQEGQPFRWLVEPYFTAPSPQLRRARLPVGNRCQRTK